MTKKYDVLVSDIDANGKPSTIRENGVMASSPNELIALYKMCGKNIQIVNEYEDEDTKNYGKSDYNVNAEATTMGSLPSNASGTMKISEDEIAILKKQQEAASQSKQTQTKPTVCNIVQQKKEPPKFFTVGGIKCKLDNGKMYQKQWMRLNDEESSEFRIVSDKNNKICPLKDRHIEIMKWVLVEDKSEDDSTNENSERVLING